MTPTRNREQRTENTEHGTRNTEHGLPITDHRSPITDYRLPIILALFILILYLFTLAHSLVLGDPTEYTFIANVLGIAHPPGYAFITLLGKLFQSTIPFGDVPWRMHLLSAVASTTSALFVYGTIRTLAGVRRTAGMVAGAFAALTVATAVNTWQHAIHANPHIITATFLAANLFFLTKWWAGWQRRGGAEEQRGISSAPPPLRPSAQKWLYAFCLSTGLGVTHHPLTVMAFPGYAIFILLVWFQHYRDWSVESRDANQSPDLQSPLATLLHFPAHLLRHRWRTILAMFGLALLGLSVWLYYPLRSPDAPFGPTGMNTLNGFLDHVLARGLSDSLPYYSLADQPLRQIVFWSILRLQYALPVIFLALIGLLSPMLEKLTQRHKGAKTQRKEKREEEVISPAPLPPRSPAPPPLRPSAPLLLYTVAFLSTYAFVISLRVQDIMAYLLGPLLVVGLLAGVGLLWLLTLLARIRLDRRAIWLLATAVFLFGPVLQIARNAARVSLRDYNEGHAYVTAVFDRFAGTDAGATLLNDWERMTPLWYTQLVEQRTPDPDDVRLEFIAAGDNPWLAGIFEFLPGGPVYLSNFRQDAIAGTEFRLRPDGPFHQVVEPGDESVPPQITATTAVSGEIEIVGYHLPQRAVTAGDFVPLTIAMRTPTGTADFYTPVLSVGDIRYEFTTDSHLITPRWQPGEVIVERFDFALPHDLASGRYPLRLDVRNLSQNESIPLKLSLGELDVTAQAHPPRTQHLLANFRQRVGLVSATVWENGRYPAPWPVTNPITAQPGDVLNVILRWEALAKAEESYTIFVHLIDANNVPLVSLDYTPLGGSMPTHLWIPKWLPGQQMWDPYRLPIPADLPPGTYFIEVGLYEMIGQRRLHIADDDGSIIGDRYILGPVVVEAEE